MAEEEVVAAAVAATSNVVTVTITGVTTDEEGTVRMVARDAAIVITEKGIAARQGCRFDRI